MEIHLASSESGGSEKAREHEAGETVVTGPPTYSGLQLPFLKNENDYYYYHE